MKDHKIFIKAYNDVKKSIDPEKKGVLPDLTKLVWYILMGVPPVPADEYEMPEAQEIAVDQRIAILKAIFVEINNDQPDDFIDKGLNIYDSAAKMAKELIKSENTDELSKFLDRYIKYYPHLENDDLI